MARFASSTKNNSRNKIGSQIAELPPALVILFMVTFFPLVNLLWLILAYGAGWYLNQMEMRQIANLAPQTGLSETQANVNGNIITTYSNSAQCSPDSNPPLTAIALPQSAAWNGLMGVTEDPNSPQVIYMPLIVNGTAINQVGQAKITTTVSVKPFLTEGTPWLPGIPGLTSPLHISYSSTIFQEEQSAPPAILIKP